MKKSILLLALMLGALFGFAQQTRTISGVVTAEENNEPLAGVTVTLKGTITATSTDASGKFQIDVPSTGNPELVISHTGFEELTVAVGNGASLSLKMKKSLRQLDEVVVIGYGQVKKRDLTGAVVSVKSDEIKKIPASNVMESLQGKIPGADITRTNGSAASGTSITIRGNRSLIANNSPLVIVDGIQYNSIQDINPNDIQSLEVLKDASSTAIYGSRGANGVIIVTTKKGSTGKAKINFNAYYGVNSLEEYPRYMTSSQYANWRREANRRITIAGINPGGIWSSSADDNLLFSPVEFTNINNGVNTDYTDLIIVDGKQQEYQVGVSAGSDKTKAYFSLDYYNEKGIFKNDALDRYTGRLNLEQSLGKIAKAGMQLQITYYDIDVRTSPVDEASKIAPFSLPYDSLGNVVLSPNNDAARWNPLIDEQPGIAINNTLLTRTLGAVFVELNPWKGLTFRTNLGMVFADSRQGGFFDQNSLLQRGARSLAIYNSAKGRTTNWENILTYNKKFGDHDLTLTGVTTFLQLNSENVSAQGARQILPSQLFYALQNATEGITIASGYAKENLISYAGRVNYSFKGKYLASLTIRTDGSSKLGEGNKWDVFPAAAFGWRIIDEDFMQGSNFLSDLKLRVSFGTTGSDAITAYRTQSSLIRIPNAFAENSALGLSFSDTVGNPNLKWEKTKTWNIGLDFGLFNSRLTGSIDFYKSQTFDLLTMKQLPGSSGVGTTFDNVGRTSNTGVDIMLNAAVIRKQDMSLNLGLTFYTNKERITELVNGVNDIVNSWFVGYPVNVIYDYEKVGIWQLADSNEAKLYNQKPGDIRVADLNGDKAITAASDRKVIGQLTPKWNAGLNIDFRYKGFDLNVFFFAKQGQTINYAYRTRVHLPGRENGAVWNYWTLENPSNEYPRPRTTSSFTALPYSSTLGYIDGSFIKLRALTIGYTVPRSAISRLGISNVRFYVSGKNLLTFSDVKDYDVERGGSLVNPLTRLVLAGVNVDF